MKYTKMKRLEIGRKIYEKQYSIREAADRFDISYYTARDYFRDYKALRINEVFKESSGGLTPEELMYSKYSKEDLVQEIIKLKRDSQTIQET